MPKHRVSGFLRDGILVDDPKLLTLAYVCSLRFAVDILSFLPLDYALALASGTRRVNVRWNRLLRVGRLLEFTERSYHISANPRWTSLLSQLLYLFIIIHWNSCLYYKMSEHIGFDSDTWVFSLKNTPHLPGRLRFNPCNPCRRGQFLKLTVSNCILNKIKVDGPYAS